MNIKAMLCCLMLAGCAGFDTAKVEVAGKGAAVADEIRDAADFALCRGITVGSWARKFGQNPKLAEAWRVLCSYDSVPTGAVPLVPTVSVPVTVAPMVLTPAPPK